VVVASVGCRPKEADELEAVYNRVYEGFERRDVNAVVNSVSHASIEEYAIYRDLALNATPEQVKQLEPWFLFDTLVMRARGTRAELEGKDARAVLIHVVEQGWYAPASGPEYAPVILKNVKVSGDSAEAEVWHEDGEEISTKACFVLEDGAWKYDYPSSGAVNDRYTQRDANSVGMSSHEYLLWSVGEMVGRDLGPEIYEPMK
jgi:hypothetical protein